MWTPSFENGGHECLVALTYNNATPFPFPSLDGGAGPNINWSIAQHNLGVLQMGVSHHHHRFHYKFQVCNAAARELEFVVAAHQASAKPDASEVDPAEPVLDHVRVGANSCSGFSLVGVLDTGTALVHVTQTIDGQVVGGLSLLVLAAN